MSSYYLDILKDRLYAYKADSIERRSAQTAMYEIMVDLVVMLAPVLSFTMEEVWQFMKKTSDMPESVLMMPWPEVKEEYIDPALEKKWEDSSASAVKLPEFWKLHAKPKPLAIPLMPKLNFMPKAKRLQCSIRRKKICPHS